ncbi:MAG: D-alanine-D-alanine ligase [Candidatus Binatota bacterium]|jgi:D-alanine-D-alanine ligase|nr:D-alanine-D-alanine ligase [Candidatus Binatota bacterium]
MKVALLHNPRPTRTAPGLPDDAFEEYDRVETIAAITRALEALAGRVEPVAADRRLPWRLDAGGYDLAFNIAEGAGRRCREAVPAAVCELLDVPVTGSDALTLGLALDKALARRVVSPEVPVAPAVLVECLRDEDALASLPYPVVVKPNDEGSSKGIRDDCVAPDVAGAIERCRALRARYGCPVLVERYLSGTEVTVGITGNAAGAAVLGMMEIAAAGAAAAFVYSLEVKRDWRRRVRYHVPPRLPASMLARLERLALTAYRLLGCRDFARIDFRFDDAGEPCFLECNPIPGLDPENSDMVLLARPTRSYDALVQGILRDAAARAGLTIGRDGAR